MNAESLNNSFQQEAELHLMRVGPIGREVPVALIDGTHYDLRPVTTDLDPEFFAGDGIDAVAEGTRRGDLPVISIEGLRIGAPVARPGAILCIGQNYAAHARESGAEPPSSPILFHKHPNTIVGAGDDILLPPGATKVDWEVELAVVIGREARYLPSPEAAADHIAGYTISNDVSERDYQLEHSGGQWSLGKNCETFNPLGPALVTADEVDAQDLGIRSWVNGESRQDSTTADMIFPVNVIVHHLSQYMVLSPGDIINTGTPQGVALSGLYPYLAEGDDVTVEIDHIGSLTNPVRA